MTGTILLTGASGYLGRRLAGRLLAETDDRLLLTVRTPSQAPRLLAELDPSAAGRVDVVVADLASGDPFSASPVTDPLSIIDPYQITGIVHAAARTAFSIGRDEAHAVNIGGTAIVARFARRCPQLERLLVLSTLYTAGRRVGAIAEDAHPAGGSYANHYEWSKAEAEAHLFATCPDLPLSVARLPTVIADCDGGRVSQYNAFHNTLKLFFYGLLSLMPGSPETPVCLATAEFTTAGVAHLLRSDAPGGVYHVSPGPDETGTLGEVIGLAFDTFESDPGFRRRRVLRPQFCDIDSFQHLVSASRALSRSPLAQALNSVAPFAEQMFLPKQFAIRRLHTAWPDRPGIDPRALAAATTAHLVRTRWGRNTDGTP